MFIVFLGAATDALGLPVLSTWLSGLVLFLPRLVRHRPSDGRPGSSHHAATTDRGNVTWHRARRAQQMTAPTHDVEDALAGEFLRLYPGEATRVVEGWTLAELADLFARGPANRSRRCSAA